MIRLLLFSLFSIPFISSYSQGINFSHQYSPDSKLALEYRVVYNQNSTDILLKIYSNDSLTSYEGILDFRSSYKDSHPDSTATIFLDQAQLNTKEKAWYLDLSFEILVKKRLLILQFVHKQSGRSYNFDIPLFYHAKINQSSTILYDSTMQIPVLANYLTTDSFYKTDQTEFISYYANVYRAALPAMSISKPKTVANLAIDTTYVIHPDQIFTFEREGMYFLENDTSSLHGTVFCVRNSPYPKYSTITHLIDPLRYITTTKEYTRLKEDPVKSNFEKIWIGITNDADRAKQIIKNYYEQVELANKLFTIYKEGWKTDKGMIYIVFGLPNEVYKTDKKETWIYAGTSQQSKLTFTFAKVDNVFSPNHYTLIRKNEFRIPWLNRVDLWRKGRIVN